MAKVTGFTADRMLVIENETVVDGEVQGDNLILLTREGTPIDAGNVRGPVGPTGPAGGVSAVNDQSGAVYSPRIFASKAALDSGWVTAPVGAIAITTDTETVWEKNATGWFVSNAYRIFNTIADRDTRWANAPEGARASAIDTDSGYYKSPAGWNPENGVRVFATAAERDARWPTPPFGAACYVLDTKAFFEYHEAIGWRPPWNVPWGPICPINVLPDGLFVGSDWVNITTITLPTLPTGRIMHVYANLNVQVTVQGTSLHYQLAWSGNGLSVLNPLYVNGPIPAGSSFVSSGIAPLPSGASTIITLRGICPAGLAGTSGPNRLWAVDAGPAA
jgi:hypothetical protein